MTAQPVGTPDGVSREHSPAGLKTQLSGSGGGAGKQPELDVDLSRRRVGGEQGCVRTVQYVARKRTPAPEAVCEAPRPTRGEQSTRPGEVQDSALSGPTPSQPFSHTLVNI